MYRSNWMASTLQSFTIIALFCLSIMATKPAMAQNELEQYLTKVETRYAWFLEDTLEHDGVVVHDLMLRSQTWKSVTWTHQLSLIVPESITENGHCLLYITGGSNWINQPKWKDLNSEEIQHFAAIAKSTNAMVAVLRQVPNQPLYVDKTEDELISFTFDQYLKTEDPTWPLLFPMVKSAVKAMDAIQDYSFQKLSQQIDHFVVSGGSKRGWTTWLTGASDQRVVAIAPMVIDVLNMDAQMDYQIEFWGSYSPMIQDYTTLQIQDRMDEGAGPKLRRLVDPYSYRDKLTIPKFIFNGTNDPYWPVDAIKFYYDDLPGEKYLHYTPNAGHGLGDRKAATQALAAYYATIVNGLPHPNVSWETEIIKNQLHIRVEGTDGMREARLWTATSPRREFRDKEWSSTPIERLSRRPEVTAILDLPESGYTACYVECQYPSPTGNGNYYKTTRMFVLDSNGILGKSIWR